MRLKDYQTVAVKELLAKAKRLIGYTGTKRIIFKAPTGSGKTIMVAEFLRRLCEDGEVQDNFSFIWTAPRQLHSQSKEKLERYFETSRVLKCSFFEELIGKRIDQNEILFFNWESINKTDNIFIRENEQDNNLTSVVRQTKEEGKTIILIIDESHHHATSDISQNLIRDISPKLTIEVSATPTMESSDETVSVQLEDVKKEGMIKKAVILNPDFINILKDSKVKSQLSKQSEETIIDLALKKRKELKKAYEKLKLNINPLVLIQLPDRKTALEDVIKNKAVKVLRDRHNITTKNGKLAIHLSEHHENLENISVRDNEVEVLIFKQALALGWDCPRAQILVLFRDWQSMVFSIQTIGRIMRMPDPDQGHYTAESLNYGYVLTNLADIEILEDVAKNYITIFTSKRRPDYKPIDLVSCHSKRHREKTRLSPVFIKVFLDEAHIYGLKNKINKKSDGLSRKLITNFKAENVDALAGQAIKGTKDLKVGGFDMQKYFDYFIRKNLTPFHPEDTSIARLKEAIYKFFSTALKMNYESIQDAIVQIILSEQNVSHFERIIDQAKMKYIQQVSTRERELEIDDDWNIPETMSFSSSVVVENRARSIMRPFCYTELSGPELIFVNYLDKSRKVVWWFKNEDKGVPYFAVPYEENNERKPFYVDFIVKLTDGSIGLFDTKAGFTTQLAGPKIDGIRKYIRAQKSTGMKVQGGIVTNTNPRSYKGRWVIFTETSKDLTNDVSNWENLDL